MSLVLGGFIQKLVLHFIFVACCVALSPTVGCVHTVMRAPCYYNRDSTHPLLTIKGFASWGLFWNDNAENRPLKSLCIDAADLSYLSQWDFISHYSNSKRLWQRNKLKLLWMTGFRDILRAILISVKGCFWSRSSLSKLDYSCPWFRCECLIYSLPTLGLRLPEGQHQLLSA